MNAERRHVAAGINSDCEVLEKTIAIDVEEDLGVVERIVSKADLLFVLIDLEVAELQAWLHHRPSAHFDIIRQNRSDICNESRK